MRKLVLLLFAVLMAFSASAEMTESLEQEVEGLENNESMDVIVRFDSNVSADMDVEQSFESFNITVMDLTASESEKLEEKNSVVRMERDRVFSTQQGSEAYSQAFSHYSQPSGRNVSVAVLDTGVADHPYLDVEASVDFTGEGTGDPDGHGTHVAGTIGSTHPFYRGVAPGADLYDLKILNSTGDGKSSDILKALDWSLRNDVDIVSMSLGSEVDRCDGRDIVSRASDSLVSRGVVVVAAAGNRGPENMTITSPGCADDVLTVGASSGSTVADFSGRGLTADGREKPDVVAPGAGIVSTFPGGGFKMLSGTSMAAPYVSGQIALMLEEEKDYSPSDIDIIVKETSTDLGLPANVQGSGKVNISASLESDYVPHRREKRSLGDNAYSFFRGLLERLKSLF